MKFIASTLLILLLSFIAGLFLPWWSIAVIAFLVLLALPQSLGKSFLAGFTGIFLLWGLLALWIDIKNGSVLSVKIAQLFPIGGSSIVLILITGLVGAFVAGFAAMSGSSLRPVRKRRYY